MNFLVSGRGKGLDSIFILFLMFGYLILWYLNKRRDITMGGSKMQMTKCQANVI